MSDDWIQRFQTQAEDKEKKYDWLGAVGFHKKALSQVLKQKDFLKVGRLQERIGYCVFRSAFQVASQDQFEKRVLEAVEAYKKAAETCKTVENAEGLYCQAMALYVDSWLHVDASQRKKVLDDCRELLKKTMKSFEKAGNSFAYGKACNRLLNCLFDRSWLEMEWSEYEQRFEEALDYSENAISALSKTDDEKEIIQTYLATGFLICFTCRSLSNQKTIAELTQTALRYTERALKLSKKTGDEYLIAWSNNLAAWAHFSLTNNLELSIKHAEESLQAAKKTKDSILIGWTNLVRAYVVGWRIAQLEEDPERKREGLERLLQDMKEVVQHLHPFRRYDWLSFAYSNYSLTFTNLANLVETDHEERRGLLDKAIQIGREGLEYAEQSGVPIAAYVHSGLNLTLRSLATIETQISEKTRLLEEALIHVEEAIRISEQSEPFFYWNPGVLHSHVALIRAELAATETDEKKKIRLLEEAVLRMEKCIGLCAKWATAYPKAQTFAWLGMTHTRFGGILDQLHTFKEEKQTLRKAVNAHEDAAEAFRKASLPTRMAEAYWHAGKLYDRLGEHKRSDQNFRSASENYKLAAGKIPRLKAFYADYALYMDAWSEIEKARENHAAKQYGDAKEYYTKAADLHKATERWNYLGPNYAAWAKLEEAEDLSRKEQTDKSRTLFQQAAELFLDAEKSIETKLREMEAEDEKEMAGSLVNASHKRRGYCLGRAILEEAKLFDRQGNHVASSRKYGSAAEMFQAISAEEPTQRTEEIDLIILLCQAWQKMMMAEAKASPTVYKEAAELFTQAKNHAIDQPTSLLAMAHSSFCKALEAGTEFELTRDMTQYSTAKKHLEAAENYYIRANFRTASEYAKATYLLFDAYMYVHKAEKGIEPDMKAQYYQMAEKLLQASADSYMKAKHTEKSEEVRRLLDNVKEKRQIVLSLAEMIHAPAVTSTTTSFSTPSPTHEKAVGLERFEHADIQANLTASMEATVEEEIEVRLDLANVAKEPGLLVRVDCMIPSGFKLVTPPSQYSIDDGSIDLKGKRLEPLKVETIKLNLLPTKSGVVALDPKVVYVDDLGKFRTCRADPVSVTVHPKLAFEFTTNVAQSVFDYLLKAFVEDYMRRKISLEKAGWRTLVQIIKLGKVSKTSVYGVGGRRGPAVSELERRGLVETRIFPGERGRGGKITKMRISYDRDTVKRHLDQNVMKIKEK